MSERIFEYEVYWDEQPGVEEGWVARMTERNEGGHIISQDDEPLNIDEQNDVAGAKLEAARYWGIDPSEIKAVDFWSGQER